MRTLRSGKVYIQLQVKLLSFAGRLSRDYLYICIRMDKRSLLYRISTLIVDIVFWCCMFVVAFLLIRILLLSSFKIPTGSMEPTLIEGDYILVSKIIPGARLFDVFAALRGEEVAVYRIPGVRPVRRNDVLVFNYPYAHSMDTVRMDVMVYYVKRCIGLPGDSVSIRDGYYRIPGVEEVLGNPEEQERAKQIHAFSTGRTEAETLYPDDSLFRWDTQSFGPLYIPSKGDSLPLTREHIALYRKLIAWEQQQPVRVEADGAVYIGNKRAAGYRFTRNYYFMGGDHVHDSLDSRYWGLVPEDYIAGKAWLVWKSVDPATGIFRGKRFLKRIR